MTAEERDFLTVAAASGWRPSDADGVPRAHPAWHDLDYAGRSELLTVTAQLRAIEACLDPEGFSSTVRAVLARIR